MSRSGYCRVSHRLHIGRVGREIRGEDLSSVLAQSLAGYLCSCPHGNPLGIFHLPAGYAMEDRGWSRQSFDEAVARLEAVGFCRYDPNTGWVWVVDLFRHEMGPDPAKAHEPDKRPDTRIRMLQGLIDEAASSPYVDAFRDLYEEDYPYLLGPIGWPDVRVHASYDAPSNGVEVDPSNGDRARTRVRRARACAPPPLLSSPLHSTSSPPLLLRARARDGDGPDGEVDDGPDEAKATAGAEEEEDLGFDLWLRSYPQHRCSTRSVRDARLAWEKIPLEARPTAEAMKRFLVEAKATAHWREQGGRWVPGLKKFVEEKGWTERTQDWATRNLPLGQDRTVKAPASDDSTRELRRRRLLAVSTDGKSRKV